VTDATNPAQPEPPPQPEPADQTAERLQRLEEACSQASYDQDQLQSHVLSLMRQLDQVTRRLARLEAALAGAASTAHGASHHDALTQEESDQGHSADNESTPPMAG